MLTLPTMENSTPSPQTQVVEKVVQTSVSKAPPCGQIKINSSEEKFMGIIAE